MARIKPSTSDTELAAPVPYWFSSDSNSQHNSYFYIRLHFQLFQEHMSQDKEGSAEQQQYLQGVCKNKTICICIDDCWDRDHYKYFNCIDQNTESRIILSTRIAGLIPRSACTEVKLSLMTTKEAVELLANGSGNDSVAVSPSMIEVARLCGHL